ncbi:MAG: hypothetical protein GX111_08255 [Clostridiales bacterium]|jgi:hypothetical protein|nr:hypothetical protein [Clostridiales bacterium]
MTKMQRKKKPAAADPADTNVIATPTAAILYCFSAFLGEPPNDMGTALFYPDPGDIQAM